MTIQYDYNDGTRELIIYSDLEEESLPQYTETNNITTMYPNAKNVTIRYMVYFDASIHGGEYAFYGHTGIEFMMLESHRIDNIPAHFCDGATALAIVKPSSEIWDVGAYAFRNTQVPPESMGTPKFYGAYSFYGTTARSVENNTCVSVGEGAFMNCSLLANVNLPNCVEYGEYAFKNTALHTINMGQNVEKIGLECFANSPMEYINIATQTPATIGRDVFLNCPMGGPGLPGVDGAIFVPDGKADAYRAAWPDYADLIGVMPNNENIGLWMKIDGAWVLVVPNVAPEIEPIKNRLNTLENTMAQGVREIERLSHDKQDALTPGNFIQISGTTISAAVPWTGLTGSWTDATELRTAMDGKQNALSAGTNITIIDNIISAGITWGTITGNVHAQADLESVFNTKQSKALYGANEPSDSLGEDGDIYVRYEDL